MFIMHIYAGSYIHSSCNVRAAVAYKYADSLHMIIHNFRWAKVSFHGNWDSVCEAKFWFITKTESQNLSENFIFRRLLFLFSVFAERCHKKLSGGLVIQHTRNVFRLDTVAALFSRCGDTDSIDELCRLDTARTAFGTGKAGKTAVDRFGIQQRFDSTLIDHGYKLMRMEIHFVIGGTGGGALAALHALFHIDTADS